MRKFVLLGVFSALALPTWAADAAAKAPAPSVAPEEIIKKFAAKEAEFAEARSNYTYRQTVKLPVAERIRNLQSRGLAAAEHPG